MHVLKSSGAATLKEFFGSFRLVTCFGGENVAILINDFVTAKSYLHLSSVACFRLLAKITPSRHLQFFYCSIYGYFTGIVASLW